MHHRRAAGDSGPYGRIPKHFVGADVLIRPGTESLSHGCAVPAPFHKGAKDEKTMKKWKGRMKMNADTFYGICTINYPPPGEGNGGAR